MAAPLTSLEPVFPVLRAFVSTIVPEATILDEERWVELRRLIDLALRDRPASLRRRVRLALHFIQWLPLLRYARPFTALDPARRARFLSFLENSPLQTVRSGFFGLRTLALLGYYGQPQAAAEIGYAATARGWDALR
ncbi:MAG: gluconate 2-dehydrogenase subunit 3 family protein [Acidobacteriia bacterium]|nr:gluconate 2-dehydrogenase subunit 3 family protein [Terriglobia bacterium]